MEKLSQSIVVGVDYSESSKNALVEAIRIAQWNDAKLRVIHAIEAHVVEDIQESYKILTDDILSSAQKKLEEFVKKANHTSTKPDLQVLVGNPFIELVRAVKTSSAELLVMGSRGSNQETKVAGVVATKCIRKAPTRVLLVRTAQNKPFKKIVACVDFSENSAKAVEQAVAIAQQEGASLDIIHIYTPAWLDPSYAMYLPSLAQFDKDYKTQYRQVLNDRMHHFLNPYEKKLKNVNVQTHIIEHQNTSYGIIQFLKENKTDLVVIGTRGRTGIKNLLLGTKAEKIIHESPCSVLAIKPDDFEYAI